jgi:hypothetical protein
MYRARGLRVRGRGGRLGEGADGWTSCVKGGCDYSGRIWRVWGRHWGLWDATSTFTMLFAGVRDAGDAGKMPRSGAQLGPWGKSSRNFEQRGLSDMTCGESRSPSYVAP